MLKNLKTAILLATMMVAFAPALASAGERAPVIILNETGGPAARVNADGTLAVGMSSTAASATVTIVDGGGSITIDDGGGALTVDGSLTSVTTVGTITNPVKITDNGGSITVDGTVTAVATDFDIRNLTAASDTVTVTGTITASTTPLATWEYDNVSINAATATTITASATSEILMICNNCDGPVFIEVGGGTAADDTGLILFGNACYTAENAAVTAVSVYNDHTSACKITASWRR